VNLSLSIVSLPKMIKYKVKSTSVKLINVTYTITLHIPKIPVYDCYIHDEHLEVPCHEKRTNIYKIPFLCFRFFDFQTFHNNQKTTTSNSLKIEEIEKTLDFGGLSYMNTSRDQTMVRGFDKLR